ncbi:hypothetical protein D5E69_13200 [Rossellomorea marisflavi]|uniref:hypothetical protein n=1 Tax=Rossellomorea marisflavi TaxID=189381 RepID=UPI0013166A5E|nr:hypothetical protein [Rossellomorea marisflavi]QHA36680.1 hypothetical protein D5E69_13200 [Rossellomorea marisflavi]
MVWFLVLLTVLVYGFVMKYVLSNMMKAEKPRKTALKFEKRTVSGSNLIPNETTR